MQFQILTLVTFLSTAIASPANSALVQNRQLGLCSSAATNPLCCDVNVLGVADLNCQVPPTIPTSVPDFNDICASIGKINMCCILPILGQALLCTSPDSST
ncbi:Hydrophobin II, HfbII [Glarea lozoyensis ATCC 20868]|uniref:Hydrophobin II, HfbII n=1 Tax=Glarea lozoyensis (strain ATCC 20868 / MF5171) TaxID=1116229 RepID=S3DKA4_GLAL2|nr:Hydrophobin II, HfbII [Glarea lozoyensis ATCC 20868]EPE32491.1 Hydrophobin II, HfbII [Glarea lozoyensis ATCC 20868]